MAGLNLGTLDTTLTQMTLSGADTAAHVTAMAAAHKAQKINEAAQQFEAVFAAEMLKPMFEGLETAPPFGGGKGEEVFRSLLLQEYGKEIAKTEQLGLAKFVKAELLKLQEESSAS
ncbi:MAG: rod-binding protein [Alphaproteobacteria bacterium]|nr:rod-binding protein [Alphaproteobacteria bacterium]